MALNFPFIVAVAVLGPWWVLSKYQLIWGEWQSGMGGIPMGYGYFSPPLPMTFFLVLNITLYDRKSRK